MGDMVKVLHADREVSFGNRHSETSTPKGFEKIIAPYYRVLACKWFMMSNGIESANVVTKIPTSSNQYLFQDFTRILLTGYMVNHSNNPRTDIGKPVFMTDLQMHWYRLCDDILENNDTIFGKTITIFRNRK